MDKITQKWLKRSKYDLDTAKAMLKSRRYLYVGFMCQQALEKILKTIISNSGKEIIRTHNLVRLAEDANIYTIMTKKHQNHLINITPYAIEARYGDYRESLTEIIDKAKANNYYKITEEVFKWLEKQKLKK